ncbi:MAG: relaxase/mobilization nuclease domain-containing protein [Leptolyngbya sp. SIOISBB]|nr:relaxase/mobilization nuclease domain-containing protein [Leptolyngbya sp. SIOISBB]
MTKGSDAHSLCAYVLNPEKQLSSQQSTADAILASNMMGQTVEELTRELEWSAEAPRRKPVQKIAAHYSVSLTPGEQLTQRQMGAVSRQLLSEMGHERCAYFAVQHHDQEHKRGVQHWHIVTATVNTANEWVSDSFSKLRIRQVERSLEERFGLVACPTRPITEQKNLTTGEARRKERTGEVLPKEKLWAEIDTAIADKPTMALLVTRLKAQDIDIRLRRGSDRYTGISFGLDGSAFAGRRLGRAYSFEGLQKYHSIYYDTAQDNTLQQVANASSAECQQKLDDYAEYQRRLRELYEQYAHSTITEPGPECDRVVAREAISAGYSEREIVEIVRQGETAREMRHEFGQREEVAYAQQLAHQQMEVWQHQQTPEQKHRQRRQRQLEVGRSPLEL